jgi:hypothetical protein
MEYTSDTLPNYVCMSLNNVLGITVSDLLRHQ